MSGQGETRASLVGRTEGCAYGEPVCEVNCGGHVKELDGDDVRSRVLDDELDRDGSEWRRDDPDGKDPACPGAPTEGGQFRPLLSQR